MTTAERSNKLKRHRGVALQFIYDNHRQQLPAMDDVELWGLMMDLGYNVGQDDVLGLLQELSDRGYVKYKSSTNRFTGRVRLNALGITPAGRDLIERTREDAAVLVP